jgi:hypothetical protein
MAARATRPRVAILGYGKKTEQAIRCFGNKTEQDVRLAQVNPALGAQS